MDYSLSLEVAKSIPYDKYEHDFTFIVNGKQYKTSRVIADLLSPIIRSYHYHDPTKTEFTINTTNPDTKKTKKGQDEDYFIKFLSLIKFHTLHLREPERKRFIQYFLQLGNVEEALNLQPTLYEDLTIENAIDKLKEIIFFIQENRPQLSKNSKQKDDSIEFDLNENLKSVFDFAASHFYEIPKEKLKDVKEEILEDIFSNESFRVESEDQLLNYVIEKYKKDKKYYRLFDFVEFQNVDQETIEKFISIFSIEDLSFGTWQKICKRLAPAKENDMIERYSFVEKPFVEGREFKGIIHYLTEKFEGNIHDKGVVDISSNSIFGDDADHHPKNLVDYDNNNCYESSNQENSKVIFDFKNRAIQLTNYSIKTYNNQQNTRHLKNWTIEVSNDEDDWIEVDSHTNDDSVNDSYKVATFDTKELEGFYRFVRLRQTGENWIHDFDTYICQLEFYGKIKQNKADETE